jgi:uncharacterized membrane protein
MDTPEEDARTAGSQLNAQDRILLIVSAVLAVALALSGLQDAAGSALGLAMEVVLPLLIAGGIAYVLLRGRK